MHRSANLARLTSPRLLGLCLSAMLFATAGSSAETLCSERNVLDTVTRLVGESTVSPMAEAAGACQTAPVFMNCLSMKLLTLAQQHEDATLWYTRHPNMNIVYVHFDQAKLSLTAIRSHAADNSTVTCAANLRISAPYFTVPELKARFAGQANRIGEPGVPPIPTGDAIVQQPITYSVEKTDDGQDYVTLDALH